MNTSKLGEVERFCLEFVWHSKQSHSRDCNMNLVSPNHSVEGLSNPFDDLPLSGDTVALYCHISNWNDGSLGIDDKGTHRVEWFQLQTTGICERNTKQH